MAKVGSDHYRRVAGRLLTGRVIPFLGAGASLCDRPEREPWDRTRFLPNAWELAEALAKKSSYPDKRDRELPRVSQWVDAVDGEAVLYEYLREFFTGLYLPSTVHEFLAALPPILERTGAEPKYPLIVTTNYDDGLERAFDHAKVPYDLVWYEAKRGAQWGKLIHRAPGIEPVPIDDPIDYDLSSDDRTVILKLHGAVHRLERKRDSYVITENHYVDYMSRVDIGSQIPRTLRMQMEESHYLFLGYSLRDWNMRVILNRIWRAQQLDLASWAVQKKHRNAAVNRIEQELWKDRGKVDLLYVPLREYIRRLGIQIGLQVAERLSAAVTAAKSAPTRT